MRRAGVVPEAAERVPHLISGVGIVLGVVLLGEGIVIHLSPEPTYDGFLGGAITSAPFIGGIIYGGYRLSRSELPVDRYGLIARWWLAALVSATLIIAGITLSYRTMTPVYLVGVVRWGAAVGGSIGLMIGISQAHSIQRRIEAEKARSRQHELKRERDRLEKFASLVSHDLRNPLNVSEGRVELLRAECESTHLDEIASANDRMKEIIEDMLTLARAGQAIDEPDAIDLAETVEGCWETVETPDATLRIEETATIEADSSRLQQLFENLVRNAIEHGGDDVLIRIGLLDADDGFYIEDDGPGFPDERRDEVFETGYSSSTEGTGFGLSVVTEVVEAHGWEIQATDSAAGGARLEITGVEFADQPDTSGDGEPTSAPLD